MILLTFVILIMSWVIVIWGLLNLLKDTKYGGVWIRRVFIILLLALIALTMLAFFYTDEEATELIKKIINYKLW